MLLLHLPESPTPCMSNECCTFLPNHAYPDTQICDAIITAATNAGEDLHLGHKNNLIFVLYRVFSATAIAFGIYTWKVEP